MTLLRIMFQILSVGEVFQFLQRELRSPRTCDPQKCMLDQVNVKEPVADSFVGQRRGMSLKCTPMLGIGPLLVAIEFFEILHSVAPFFDESRVYRLCGALACSKAGL